MGKKKSDSQGFYMQCIHVVCGGLLTVTCMVVRKALGFVQLNSTPELQKGGFAKPRFGSFLMFMKADWILPSEYIMSFELMNMM